MSCGMYCVLFCGVFVLLFCLPLLVPFPHFTDVHTWFHSSNHSSTPDPDLQSASPLYIGPCLFPVERGWKRELVVCCGCELCKALGKALGKALIVFWFVLSVY